MVIIEADKSNTKNEKERRGGGRAATRILRQIKQAPSSEKFNFNNNNKEKIKKLSAVNRESAAAASLSEDDNNYYEMGCDVIGREDGPSTSCTVITNNKKFKLPRKRFFDDCNGGAGAAAGVDHLSVPRKLRSVMKKRNRESISPPFQDSKKLKYSTCGVESPKRVGIKKSKSNLKQGGPNWSTKQSNSGPITKDEEEVVETLYALAGMFPDSELDSETKNLDNASVHASLAALPDAWENHPPKLEGSVGVKEDLNAVNLLRTDESVNPSSDINKSHEGTIKDNSLIRPRFCEPSDFPSFKTSQREFGISVAEVNLQKTCVKHEEQKSPSSAVNYCLPLSLHQHTGKLKQPVQLEVPQLNRKPELALGLTATIGSQFDPAHLTNESKNNGSGALWSGMSSNVPSTSCPSPLPQSFGVKMPAWLGTTARQGPVRSDSSIGKVSKGFTDKRSWKRCATHIHVSRLIQALEKPEVKKGLQLLPNQLRPHEILKQGVLMTINDFNGFRNDLNGVASVSSNFNKIENNSSDAKSGSLQHLRLHQDRLEHALPSGGHTSQKQVFNFLSVSAGGGGTETNNSLNGAVNGLEPMTRLQVPYHTQHPTIMPFSSSQAQYVSAYPDQPSAAGAQQAQLQSPSHFSSPYCGPRASPKTLTKQQHQQRLWAAQLTAQYRNTATSTGMAQFPSWQNGRQDPTTLIPYNITPVPSTLEVLGHKYPQISQQQHHQQQQQFIAITHARMKRQDHHLPSVYEETGVGFRTNGGALPLQLLCNERL